MVTWPFPQINMQHEAYGHGENIRDMTWAVPSIRHGTLDNITIYIDIAKVVTGDIVIFKFNIRH